MPEIRQKKGPKGAILSSTRKGGDNSQGGGKEYRVRDMPISGDKREREKKEMGEFLLEHLTHTTYGSPLQSTSDKALPPVIPSNPLISL